MSIRSLITQTAGVGLLLLTGCEASRNMRDDLLRLTSSQPTAQKSQSAKSVASTRPSTAPPASSPGAAAVAPTATSEEPPAIPAATATSDQPPALPAATSSPLSLIGKSETELRAVLGAPRSEEDRPPGRLWRYQDGQCTLVVQLYPDVHTKQFRTLGYEVKSDDNTDQGKAVCMAQLQSRAQTRP